MSSILSNLLYPVTITEFYESYFESKHLLVKASNPEKFNGVMTGGTIDEVLMHQALSIPLTRMAKKDADLEAKDYTLEGTNTIDPAKVSSQFADGATLILSSLQFRVPTLKNYCDSLATELGQRIQTNIYCTPGSNSQGFLVHHDTHDVIILQIEGTKRWKIYESPIELAVKDQQFYKDKHRHGKVIDEFTMEQGDLLYIPRGLMHAAVTESDRSIHVTTGVMGDTFQDLMVDEINRLVLTDPILRRGLFKGYQQDHADLSRLRESYSALITKLSEKNRLEQILKEAHKKFVATYPPILDRPLGNIKKVEELESSTQLYHSSSTPHHLEIKDDLLTIYMCNRELELPVEFANVVQSLAEKERFKVSEIPGMDIESQLEFAETLVEFGFLRIDFK